MEEITRLLNNADELKTRLSEIPPLPIEALKKIQDAFEIEYTYESNFQKLVVEAEIASLQRYLGLLS